MATASTKKTNPPLPRVKHRKRITSGTTAGSCSVQEIRQKLGVTRKVFSRLTGYSERAIASWESGRKPDEPGLRRVRETERFQERLAEVVQPKEIPEWLDTPN